MYRVEGASFETLQEARQYTWDLPYGDPRTIWSVDNQPVERWHGRKEVGLVWEHPAGHHKTIITENQHERAT